MSLLLRGTASRFEFGVRIAGHQQLRDEPGPSGLVRGANTAAGVAMEVFVEQDVITEVRIGLQPRMVSKLRPRAALVGKEDPGQPCCNLVGRLVQGEEPAGAGRA